MTDKVVLTNLANLQNETTAVNAINANSAAITTAMDNTLSRDGTSPNTMGANFDMNSHHILNLPQPATSAEPLRLQDLSTFTGGGTVTNIPAGGTNGQLLAKNSSTDYDVHWIDESSDLTAGTNIAITGTTPTTISTTANPTFATSTTTPIIAGGTAAGSTLILKSTSNVSPSGDSTTVNGTTITIANPASGASTINLGRAGGSGAQLVVAGTSSGSTLLQATGAASGTITIPAATDTLVGKATTDTLTNKTFDTAGAGNVLKVNAQQLQTVTGASSAVAVASTSSPTGSTVPRWSSGMLSPGAITDDGTNIVVAGAITATTAVAGTAFNKVVVTPPASTATLTIANNKTLTANNSLTLAGTDATTLTFQASDTYVGRATTDTLTNKTFDTAGTGNAFKVNGTTVTTASTILDTISSTQGTVLYRNASNWVALAPGTSGQFLQTTGPASNPIWVTGSGATTSGNRTLIATLTASSSQPADTTSLTSTFSRYELVLENIVPVDNNCILRLRVNVAGVQTTGYLAASFIMGTSGTGIGSATTYIPLSRVDNSTLSSTAANGGLSGVLLIEDPSNATRNKLFRTELSQWDTTNGSVAGVITYGTWNTSTAAVTGVQFSTTGASGNIASGTIKIFGIVN